MSGVNGQWCVDSINASVSLWDSCHKQQWSIFSPPPFFPRDSFQSIWTVCMTLHCLPSWLSPAHRTGKTGIQERQDCIQKRKSLPKQSSPNSNRSGRLRRASWRGHCFGWLVHCQIPSLPIQAVFPTYYLWYIYFYHSIFSAGQSSLTLSENCFAKRQQMVEAIHYPILYSCLISPPRVLYLPLSKFIFSSLIKHSKNSRTMYYDNYYFIHWQMKALASFPPNYLWYNYNFGESFCFL